MSAVLKIEIHAEGDWNIDVTGALEGKTVTVECDHGTYSDVVVQEVQDAGLVVCDTVGGGYTRKRMIQWATITKVIYH